MYATVSLEAEAMAVLREFASAYAIRDLEKLLAVFLPEPDVVLLGTGQDEKRLGLTGICEQAERDWEQADTLHFRFGWRSVSCYGDVCWIAADCFALVQAGYRQAEIPLRITAVLVRNAEDSLRIAQLHYSSPVLPEDESDTCLE
ncbi:hypothetical protein Enr8_01070 [Blastopirellula retiformator]|uniref:SnoaL-like domain-containing protein n=2 Tax=Blastopirellula retiformator TaxID=2527970 RepID=A0A5C5VKQ3_9BACT|nr:hypothetical protein Enr8_01070 [Blastopirellula retiformator]